VREPPTEVVSRVRFWDAAGSETERSPYTAGVLLSESRSGIFYIEDVQRDRLVAAKVDALMLLTAQLDGPGVEIAEEQEPGSAGKAVIAAHRLLLAGYSYTGITATGDKVTRWKPLASQARPLSEGELYGRVKLVVGAWNKTFLDEVVANRRSRYKDQLDAAAGALYQLRLAARPVRMVEAMWG
jgi:phage terminase large subunit-like protein